MRETWSMEHMGQSFESQYARKPMTTELVSHIKYLLTGRAIDHGGGDTFVGETCWEDFKQDKFLHSKSFTKSIANF